jgi:pilus assembly protein CpaE
MNMTALSAALVAADRTLREETLACIDNLPVRIIIDQRALDDVEDLLDRTERSRVDVILLEASLLKMPLEEFARKLKMTASEPVIFILQTTAVPDAILEAMQAGAREYLCPPLGKPLKEALERLSGVRAEQLSAQQRKLGRIFGFLSAKGGCGATTFASHVATISAKQTDKPLLLADVDFEAGLLRFILKAKPRYTLRDALDNMHRMDSSYFNALVTRHGQLEFIAAPEELTERTLPDPRTLGRLLRFVRTLYPVTMLDFGRFHSGAALDSVPELDTLFLIVTQDLYALDNAKEFIRMAGERGKAPERIQVLLNKVPARQKADFDGLESYLGVRPAGAFSDDTEALYETWSEGRLLAGESVLGRQLTTLAKSLMAPDMPQTATREAGSKSTGGKSSDTNAAPSAIAAAMRLGRFLSFMRSSRA